MNRKRWRSMPFSVRWYGPRRLHGMSQSARRRWHRERAERLEHAFTQDWPRLWRDNGYWRGHDMVRALKLAELPQRQLSLAEYTRRARKASRSRWYNDAELIAKLSCKIACPELAGASINQM